MAVMMVPLQVALMAAKMVALRALTSVGLKVEKLEGLGI